MNRKRKQRIKLLHGTVITGIGTLFSRLLGMLRDSVTASTLGMSAGGIMDSFVLAFRIPDVARRMFGEGSLSAGFIPIFSKLWLEDRPKAWKLLTVALFRMFLLLTIFVILGELLCILGMNFFPVESRWYLVSHLAALMLPYLILICMTALSAAALQSIGSFAPGSAVPMILNLVWLFGLLVIAPRVTDDPQMECYLLTICILVAGVLQFLILLPFLRKHGAVLDYDPITVGPELLQISKTFFPQIFGLMSIQIYILVATLFAWMLSGNPEEGIPWLGKILNFPMERGAPAAIYFSERLYEFPQGLLGLAVATAIYPILGRHAAKKEYKEIADGLNFGLRLVIALGIPAGVGLAMLSENLAHLLYQRNSFTEQDMFRTADMIFWFAGGVWAFCSIPILVRGFYVMEDMKTPLRIGFRCVLVHFLLCAVLIWPMAEQGLALATSISAALQSVLLLFAFSRIHHRMNFRKINLAVVRSVISSAIMVLAIYLMLSMIPGSDSFADILHILMALFVGVPVFAACFWLLGGRPVISLSVKTDDDEEPRKKKRKRRKKP